MKKKKTILDDEIEDFGRPIEDPDIDNELPSDPGRYVALDGELEAPPWMADWIKGSIRRESRA